MKRPKRSDDLKAELRETRIKLETYYSVIAVAVAALERQDADGDMDIARMLTRCVLTPISFQIDRLCIAVGDSRDT